MIDISQYDSDRGGVHPDRQFRCGASARDREHRRRRTGISNTANAWPRPPCRPKAAPPDVADNTAYRMDRWGAGAQLHRRGDLAPAAVRLGQRGLQDPRRGQSLPRQRHRRDVAGRLRLPALPRRPDVLGRHDRRRRGLPPDRPPGTSAMASAGPPPGSCAASPKPALPYAKQSLAGRCDNSGVGGKAQRLGKNALHRAQCVLRVRSGWAGPLLGMRACY
jgi:hypothetical protein